ncbi:MAG: helix-turn-helix transcriptional regulator [Bacteroidales bacterium]|nr:helix-turn-helix transcriptional regulator [Bacteroidales bacterium]
MIDRINLIMRAKNITASQFADEINIQRSGMSHIMSGRNKPSLDFVMRVLNRYPEIDTNWLLFGKGEMYKSANTQETVQNSGTETALNIQTIENQMERVENGGQMDIFSSEMTEITPQNTISEVVENEVVENTSILKEVENQAITNGPKLDENYAEVQNSDGDKEKPIQKKETRKAVRYLVFYSDHTFEEFTRAED